MKPGDPGCGRSRGTGETAGWAWAVLLGTLAATSGAWAQPRAVQLELEGCPPQWAPLVGNLAALELSPRPVRLQSGRAPGAIHAHVRCTGLQAELRVHGQRRAQPHTLNLDLQATDAPARPRLLALTLSELVVTSQMEIQAAPPAASPRAGPRAAVQAAAPAPPHPTHGWVSGGVGVVGRPNALVGGLQLGLTTELGPLDFAAGVQGEWGRTQIDAAQVEAWMLSLRLAAGGSLQLPSVTLFALAGARVGYAHLQGSSPQAGIEGTSLADLWLAPALEIGSLLWLVPRAALRIAIELGAVTRAVRGLDARDQPLFGLEGLRLQAGLGVLIPL